MERFTARYERQDNQLWSAHLEDRPEVHAAGRSLSAAQKAIAAAAARHGIDAETQLQHRFSLSCETQTMLDGALKAREDADAAERVAAELRKAAVELTGATAQRLLKHQLSLRDIATILGVSHTRIQQLIREDPGRPRD